MSTVASDNTIDVSALPSPRPVLHAWRALKAMRSGQVLRVVAPGGQTAQDLNDFARLTGHTLQAEPGDGATQVFLLQKR